MKTQISKSTITACLWLFFLTSVASTQQNTAFTGEQILAQVKANYAQCQSYMDSGQVQTVYIRERERRTEIKPFTTAFVRPGGFRFEFQSRRGELEWDRYIVWQKDSAVKSLWTPNEEEREFNDLGRALAGPTGVSGGSASLMPALLLPQIIRGGLLKVLTNVTLVGEDSVGKFAAYKLEALDLAGRTVTLWIDKGRLVLLRLYQKRKIDPSKLPNGKGAPFETENTITFDPVINEPVPATRLEFLVATAK